MRQEQARWIEAALVAMALLATTAGTAAQDQHAESFGEASEEEHLTRWSLSAGGVLNTGNTKAYTINAGTTLRLVRGSHAFGLDGLFGYGRANLGMGYQETQRQFNGRLRYDFFFSDNDALFAAQAYRWDTFAGLDLRLQTQVGYLRNFVGEENHRFWGELGYDLTYDNFTSVDGTPLAVESDVLHSARIFLGYDNHLNEHVGLTTGVETLIDVEDTENVRVNWLTSFRSTISSLLQLELSFLLQFDNVPVQGAESVDTTTQLSLIFNFVDETEAAAE